MQNNKINVALLIIIHNSNKNTLFFFLYISQKYSLFLMATTGEDNVAQHIQRLSDIDTETLEMLMPIDGYEDMPLVPLDIAVEPLVSLVPAIHILLKSDAKIHLLMN
jgi:hypothetical protein